jgi:ApbE superfamily uncharacterized protein (UPF0280 family)
MRWQSKNKRPAGLAPMTTVAGGVDISFPAAMAAMNALAATIKLGTGILVSSSSLLFS